MSRNPNYDHRVTVDLDPVELDAIRVGLMLLRDDLPKGMSPTPLTTGGALRHSSIRHGTYTEDRAAGAQVKAHRLALARLDRKLRAVA